MTNREKLKSLSNLKLAIWLCNLIGTGSEVPCKICKFSSNEPCTFSKGPCEDGVSKWLDKECEE